MTKRMPRVRKQVNPELLAMMQERLQAHRRGQFVVLGSISLIETFAGALRFPVSNNVPTGPTVGYMTDSEKKADLQKLIVLTPWEGVPALTEKTEEFCPACLHGCHVCNESGRKICEGVGCGGSGYTLGPADVCPECVAKSGKFDPQCNKCQGNGAVYPKVECVMCKGSGQIVCSFCKGQTRYSTGLKGGSTDFLVGRCTECHGFQRKSITKEQKIDPHVNALLPDPRNGPVAAVGPIFSFVVDLSEEQREQAGTPVRMFDVRQDAAGDQLFMLIDSTSTPAWPYLVGGLITEHNADANVMMISSR
jgi:hypothetical protein